MAAGSELVKCMWLLIMVSRFPWIVTVTITENGKPAVAVGGAVKASIACGVAQPNVIDIAIAALNVLSRRADSSFPVPHR